jgi:hypothetical protein
VTDASRPWIVHRQSDSWPPGIDVMTVSLPILHPWSDQPPIRGDCLNIDLQLTLCFRSRCRSSGLSARYQRRPCIAKCKDDSTNTASHFLISMAAYHSYRISLGLAPAAVTSPSISCAPLSSRLPSHIRTHQAGGSIGRCPSCSPGQTSAKKYQTCPTTTPSISSLGIDPCMHKLNTIKTHGSHGAVKTNIPKKLNRVSGLRRDQM